ncbi:DUF4083 family protein [Bacillus massiliglaciei]|uniref:DUF4083 family protein n=1 Tax=Bacillus massiliglaciei TaxID=1816693 RepID=UPI000DA62F02|nr:DUF4083 family protein [Bacillus massiliglaciei]
MVNISDLIFQLIIFIFLIGVFFAVFFLVRSLLTKKSVKSDTADQKLDRIIQLLEQDKKE